MGGKYKGKHAAGNVERPQADSARETTDDEKLEEAGKDRPTPNDVKQAAERLKDEYPPR
ncbi:hypothetical protein [Phytoactinopolyspora halotolerans]|uniref:Uncharacterized protein n=1 Tax=Phytoactinopolyspora halotolerans TaxID=1981512 RepID=A0A6L9S5E6_9ACTN|nr:hypothetical protein [Phytoactinopolyspora halotolerans]NED99970.1 hypothetical protein [Phytoactinopolyspora halotolerans]